MWRESRLPDYMATQTMQKIPACLSKKERLSGHARTSYKYAADESGMTDPKQIKVFMNKLMLFLSICLYFILSSCYNGNLYVIPIKNYIVAQNGMYPTFSPETMFWAVRRPYFNLHEVQRGDIVIYKEIMSGRKYYFVWRVIGIPGDKIKIRGTTIEVNGRRLKHIKVMESETQFIYSESNCNAEYLVAYGKRLKSENRINLELKVPAGELFLMGDNRDNTMDGRFTGTIPFEKIIGKKI